MWAVRSSMPEVAVEPRLRPDLEPLAHRECVICRDMAHLRSDAREKGDREAVADCNAHISNHPHTQTPKTSALTQGSRT